MDYKAIAFAVVNGDYSHSSIAMARYALEILGAPLNIQDSIEDDLYSIWNAHRKLNGAPAVEKQ